MYDIYLSVLVNIGYRPQLQGEILVIGYWKCRLSENIISAYP